MQRVRELISPSDRTQDALHGMPEERLAPGYVFAFLAAHSSSKVRLITKQLTQSWSRRLSPQRSQSSVLLADFSEPGYSRWQTAKVARRLDRRSWSTLVREAEGHDRVDFSAVNLPYIGPALDYARLHYRVSCIDLSSAKPAQCLEVLRSSDSIFVVSNTDRLSLDGACDRAEWLRAMGLAENCGLILWRSPHGATAAEAEDLTGFPVCSLLGAENRQLELLAQWLAPRPEFEGGSETQSAEEQTEEATESK